jgi:hypothetical protein
MKPSEIRAWAISVIERTESGQPTEDMRVELKAEWPDPKRAARRIAGHANAAHGEPILWLIGIDEKAREIKGAQDHELSAWMAKLKSEFDQFFAPECDSLNIHWGDVTIVALLFRTEHAPFVVKNPDGGGPITYEVPWRDGTAIRSATRADLLRLLVPRSQLPDCDVLDAFLRIPALELEEQDLDPPSWMCEVQLYVAVLPSSRVTIASHRCEGFFEIHGCVARTIFPDVRVGLPNDNLYGQSHYQVSLSLPTVIVLRAFARVADVDAAAKCKADANIGFTLTAIEASEPLVIRTKLVYRPTGGADEDDRYEEINWALETQPGKSRT